MATKQQRMEQAEKRLKVMGHRVRSAALLVLYERTASPAEIARELGESVGKVAYHVKKLVDYECAELVSTRQVRGATEHFYRATEQHLIDTEEWEDLPPEVKENLAVEFAQPHIDEIVLGFEARTLGRDENFHLSRTRHTVDKEGQREIMAIFEQARLDALEAEARAGERLANADSAEGFVVTGLLGCFEVPAPE